MPITPGDAKLILEQRKRREQQGQDNIFAPVPVEQKKVPGGRRGQQAVRLTQGQLPTGTPTPKEVDPADVAAKQFVSEYFDFTDLSVPQRISRITGAGGAILGNILASEAPWAVPSQFLWRMVRGDSLAENWAAAKRQLTAPTLRKMFHAAPFLPKEFLVSMAVNPGATSEKMLGDAFMETVRNKPITWKEALNESDVPWAAAQPIYNALGLDFLYDIQTKNYMDANPGEGIATIGGVTQYLDQQRIEDRKEAAKLITSHLPDNWMQREIVVPFADKQMTIEEALIEVAGLEAEIQNEIRYQVGEVLIDPVILDDLAGGPVITGLAKLGWAGAKFIPRGVRMTSRLGRAWNKGPDEVAEVVAEAGRTTTSKFYTPNSQVAYARPIERVEPQQLLPISEERLALPSGRRTPAEAGQPEFVGGPRATEQDVREIRDVMAGAASQSKLSERIVELHDEARVLGNQQQKLADRMGAAAAAGNMEEAMRLNEEWVNGPTTKALEEVQAKIEKLEGVRMQRMQTERTMEQVSKTGTVLPQSKLIDDPLSLPGGMQVEGMPSHLLTVDAANAPFLLPEHVLAGVMSTKVRGGRLIGDTGLQHSVHHFTSGDWQNVTQGVLSEEIVKRSILLSTHDLRSASAGDIVAHYIRPAGNLSGEGMELQAIYRVSRKVTGEETPVLSGLVLTPMLTEGGVPIRPFTSEVLPEAERTTRVASKMRALDEGTPLYHHTRIPFALGMLYDRKIVPLMHREKPWVSFTRFDATSSGRIRARPYEAELLPGKKELPTTPDYFNFEFGGMRLVTTREELTQKYGKPKPHNWHATRDLTGKSKIFEAEERVSKAVDLDDILKVEIDPTEFAASTSSVREANYNMLDSVIKGFEDMGIPVEIRPLHLQNEIETFRPRNDPKYYLEKVAKGEDTAEMANRTIRHIATTKPVERPDGSVIPAADLAGEYIQYFADADRKSDYVGKHIDEKLGIMQGTKTTPHADPNAFIEGTFKEVTGAVGDKWKYWVPDIKVVLLEGAGGGKPPTLEDLQNWVPDMRLLPPPGPGSDFGDLGWARSIIDEPIDALSRIDHPNAGQIWNRLTEGRYETAMYLSEVEERLSGVERIMRKNLQSRVGLFRLLDTKPDTPEFVTAWKAASPELQQTYREARRELDAAWDMMVARGVIDPDDFTTPGYLRGYAPHIFPRDSDVSMGAIPYGLHDVPLNGNVMLGHLEHRYGAPDYIEDAMLALRTYFVGVANKTFKEPMYNDILQLAGAKVTIDPVTGKKIAGSAVPNFPQVGRKYVEDLVRELKGYPGTIESRVRHNLRVAAQPDAPMSMKIKAGAGKATATLTNFVSNALYRGLLMGSPHYWAQNFFTQGVLNPAAVHGPFWTMKGIARHMDGAWRGLEPQPALLGGFHALFEDLPNITGQAGDLATKWSQQPGAQQLGALLKELDRKGGVSQVETQMRGIAFHIGFGKKLQEYEALNGIPLGTITPENITDMLTPGQIRRAMLEGMKESDNVNFVYGVYGSNPTLRHFFGGKSLAVTFQFMSYYGKQLAFLERNSRVRKDPGLIFRYLETWGVMSRLLGMANVSGDEFNIFNEVGEMNERFVEHGEAPLGPVPQMTLDLWTATSTEDPEKAARAMEDFFSGGTKAVPLIQAVTTEMRALERGRTGLRFNTVTGEVMRPTQPSETLANVLGLTSQTEEDVRREEKALKRMDQSRNTILRELGNDGAKAIDERNKEELDRVRQLAARFGIDPSRVIDSRLERMMYSRLARMVEDTGGQWETDMYIQGLREEMPMLFDGTQAQRYMEYREQKRGLEQDLIDPEEQKSQEEVRRIRRILLLNKQTGGKNVPRP